MPNKLALFLSLATAIYLIGLIASASPVSHYLASGYLR